MKNKSSRVQLIVAVLTLVGVLGAAIISNWDKLFTGFDGRKANIPNQSSFGTASPNIGNIQGNVNISVNEPSLNLDIPDFSKGQLDVNGIQQLEEFIDTHKGKLVHLNVAIPDRQSAITETNEKEKYYIMLAAMPCDTERIMACVTSHLVFTGSDSDFELGWYQDNILLAGYFVINEISEFHQGVVFGLKAVSREEVLLQTQRKMPK